MLDGITTFVTGASQGIGRVIATEVADEGANVVLATRGDGIYETEEMIDADDRTLTVETDVTRGRSKAPSKRPSSGSGASTASSTTPVSAARRSPSRRSP